MSTWKELPRPATPGPWEAREGSDEFPAYVGPAYDSATHYIAHIEDAKDAAAIAALPDYVTELDRRRAWLDWLLVDWPGEIRDRIRAGEWPEGSKP